MEKCKHPEIDKRIEEVYAKYTSKSQEKSQEKVQEKSQEKIQEKSKEKSRERSIRRERIEDKENEEYLLPNFGNVEKKTKRNEKREVKNISRIDIKEVSCRID